MNQIEKEIFEQPDIVRKNSYNTIPDFSNYKKITIIANGFSYNAGLVGKNLIEKYGNIPVDVQLASEFRYRKLFIDKNDLVIVMSQDSDTLISLEALNSQNYNCLGIVNENESGIACKCNNVICINTDPENNISSIKDYAAQTQMLSLIAYNLAKNSDDPKVLKEISRFILDIKRLPLVMKHALEKNADCISVAKDIHNSDNIIIIGKGIDYATAKEGALNFNEIAHANSYAYDSDEAKNTIISTIDSDSSVIGITSDIDVASNTKICMDEFKDKGANVIHITAKNLSEDWPFYHKKIELPETSPILQPIINIIPVQLIAYNVAKLNNFEKPKSYKKEF